MDRLGLGGRLSREGAFALHGRAARPAGHQPARSSARTRGRSAPARWSRTGSSAPLVRAAGEEWDVGIARAACFLAAAGRGPARGAGRCGAATGPPGAARPWPCSWRSRCWCPPRCCRSASATPPSRGSTPTTRPTRSSSAGSCCWTARTPTAPTTARRAWSASTPATGASPSACGSARCRWSTTPTSPAPRSVGAAWRLVPSPFDDYRVFVLLMTLAGFAAAMAFRAPLSWRLTLGVLIAANPIAVRSAWFGQNDAPSHHADGAGVRTRHARAVQVGRGVTGGGGAAEAVRRGRHPVPGADAGEAGGGAGGAQALRRRLRGSRRRSVCLPFLSPTPWPSTTTP